MQGMTSPYLAHHGIKGQKWGVRRFQNPDGTLTQKGRAKYSKKYNRKLEKQMTKLADMGVHAAVNDRKFAAYKSRNELLHPHWYASEKRGYDKRSERIQKRMDKGQQKLKKMLAEVHDLGLNVDTSAVVQQGRYYVDNGYYTTVYTMPVTRTRYTVH